MDQLFNFFMVSNTNNTTFTKPKVGVDTVLQNLMMKFEERREHQGYRRVAHLSAGQYIETTRRNNETNDSDQTDDNQDLLMSQHISSLLVDCLRNAREKELSSKVFIPCGLTDRVASDIYLMSKDEPCGIRGCAVDVVMEDGELCQRLGKVILDPNTVTTFEITLVLAKDTPRWLVSKLQSYLRDSYEPPTTVKQSYKLIKRKLYRSDSIVSVREYSS